MVVRGQQWWTVVVDGKRKSKDQMSLKNKGISTGCKKSKL